MLRSTYDFKIVDYDTIFIKLTSIFVGKYLIVDDYNALGDTIRIKLPSYCLFDVVTNILVTNESLRRAKHFWQRFRNVNVSLIELWPSFFNALLDWRSRAADADDLRTILINVEQKYAHNYFVFATLAATSCPSRSTPNTVV